MPIGSATLNARTINAGLISDMVFMHGGINACTINETTINDRCHRTVTPEPPIPEAPTNGNVGGVYSQRFVFNTSKENQILNLLRNLHHDDMEPVERVDRFSITVQFGEERSNIETYIIKQHDTESFDVRNIETNTVNKDPVIQTDLISIVNQQILAKNYDIDVDIHSVSINTSDIKVQDIVVKRKT